MFMTSGSFKRLGILTLLIRSGNLKKYKKQILVILIVGLFMGGMCLLMYEPMMQLLKDPAHLKNQLQSYSIFGYLLFALIMCLQVVFVFLPGEIVEVVAGFLYGPWLGMLVCLAGAAIGTCIIYGVVGKWGKKWIHLFVSEEKIKSIGFLQDDRKLPLIIFIIFFIPGTPKDIITYFLPLTSMKLTTFLWISSIARVPSVISSTIAGNALGIQEYGFCFLVFAITGIISCLGLYGYKNWTSKQHKIKSLENL